MGRNISVKRLWTPLNKIWQRFTINEKQIAAHLEAVRQQLPTTEVVLIGKPQAGKSSIVRGMTGQPEDIVGQGFRPHTRNTQRYPYPSEELPLLIFTDTVGLGDIERNTQAIIEELTQTLKQDAGRSRIFILTIKITDFATDSLKQVISQLRQDFAHIPCLLALTCLHELYDSPTDNHPDYPPQMEAMTRAAQTIEEGFGNLCDRTLLLDFTLEEDNYHPVFYGLGALQDALDDLLPKAQAQAIHQLLETDEQGKAIGGLYRRVARHYISAFAVMAGIAAAVPLPFATMPVLTSLQVSMVAVLGRVYGQALTFGQALSVIGTLAGGFFAQAVGRELVKFVPGVGSVVATSWAVAYTWALGEGACVYFGDLMAGKVPDPDAIQELMGEAFQQAKQNWKNRNQDE
ncbi:50S ribosome-binding GTPase [Oscillatoria sp. CS-180]|uniref:YcjF family protein n=1 Tax=Oscillatoria sp. CS-180 TaxID=3021720 RepID=UPI002330277B|nr:GTPase [Oscillatoria sp. CS-180]MDB9526674.1 50S ribosome-binding GTPase [Oscillatoria sp. CS-180]